MYLFNNHISNISPDTFSQLPIIQLINLFGNKLTKIDDYTFKSLKNLDTLFLGNNRLVEIEPKAFEGLSKLKWLQLSGNRLASLSSSCFRPLISIGAIDLDKNLFDLKIASFLNFYLLDNYNFGKDAITFLIDNYIVEDWNLFIQQFDDFEKSSVKQNPAVTKISEDL